MRRNFRKGRPGKFPGRRDAAPLLESVRRRGRGIKRPVERVRLGESFARGSRKNCIRPPRAHPRLLDSVFYRKWLEVGRRAIQSAMLRRSKRGSSTAQRGTPTPRAGKGRAAPVGMTRVGLGARNKRRLPKRARYIVPLLWATVPSSTELKLLSYTKREYAMLISRRYLQRPNRKPARFSERFLAQVGRGLPAPPAI